MSQPDIEPHVFGAKTSGNWLIPHPIGRPIHIDCLKKNHLKSVIFGHFR
jgi:hypothetical protein